MSESHGPTVNVIHPLFNDTIGLIYLISLYSSLSPHSPEERRVFPPAGVPGEPTSGTLPFPLLQLP